MENMQTRVFTVQDKEVFIHFATQFYATDSVLHSISVQNMEHAFEEIVSDSPYVDGFMLLKDNQPAGYAIISYTYSMEMGGMLAVLDELFVAPEFQGQGIGGSFLKYMKENLSEGIKAFRLEFVTEKEDLQRLYEKIGFKMMGYTSMIQEVKQP